MKLELLIIYGFLRNDTPALHTQLLLALNKEIYKMKLIILTSGRIMYYERELNKKCK